LNSPSLTANVHTHISNQKHGCPIDLRYFKRIGKSCPTLHNTDPNKFSGESEPGILPIIQDFERILNERVAEVIGNEIQKERLRREIHQDEESGQEADVNLNWRPQAEYSSSEEDVDDLEWAGGGGGDGGGMFEKHLKSDEEE
jgi:hypothetical protein